MNLQIKALSLGEMRTNCYLVWDDLEQVGLVIDPAEEGDYISQKILEAGFKPLGIILTHGHFDHCLGLLEVKLNFKSPIYLAAEDWPLYKRARSSAKHFLGADPGPMPPIDEKLEHGQEIIFGQQKLEVMATPGHTPGSVCLTDNTSLVFTGDTLFEGGVGRTDFSYSSAEKLSKSLRELLLLPGWCKIYPGHGRPSTIKMEALNFPV